MPSTRYLSLPPNAAAETHAHAGARGAREIYKSFWHAGFEGADHINGSAKMLCMNTATGHLEQAEQDYGRLATLGIRTVRESAGWRCIERNGRFDFARVGLRARAARKQNLQILWTVFHYGVPDGLDIFSHHFIPRFANYCAELARYLKTYGDADTPPVYTPINEISFLTWAVCETGLMHPHVGNRRDEGYALKKHLVSAAIAGCEAIWSVEPHARMLHVDPVIHIAAPRGRPDLEEPAAVHRRHQFQAWDMLGGLSEAELGGSRRHLDLIGINYYHDNQWEHGTGIRLSWHLRDTRRLPLSQLLREVHDRYGRPITITETSHVGAGRGAWIEEIGEEVLKAHALGVPIDGVCLYPAINRPDWERPGHWHESGLWEVDAALPGLPRRLNRTYARALLRAQRKISRGLTGAEPIGTAAVASASFTNRKEPTMHALIVFSHLRWNFVYQRPQHLLSRLAAKQQILFVEEPICGAPVPHMEVTSPAANVYVLRAHTPIQSPGFHDDQFETIRSLLAQQIEARGLTDHSVWLYTPMALPLLDGLKPKAVIYDCMDELSAFKHASKQLLPRETTLMKLANVVFTGGPSLYDAKRDRHPNAHCVPSSVDLAHFSKGIDPNNAHADLQHIGRPRLGFFGVLDERLDISLLASLAAARPDWQLCLVGPVVKIDPAELPQAPNIHYFPQQPYEALPLFLAGWDVCLLPFARNDATKFISPTKTLEYMAALRPVVSTPIADVGRLYADGVALADGVEAFIEACEQALHESDEQRAARVRAQRHLTESTSWDATAARIGQLIDAARADGLNAEARVFFEGRHVVALPTPAGKRAAQDSIDCLILGAGPTGLSAAYHYGEGSVLVERGPSVGGWCRSIEDHGFVFDHAGHIMFSKDPYVLELYETLLGDNLHWQDREAWVYSKGVHTRYPFQGALYGLPPQVLKECIVGAIEARFGSLQANDDAQPKKPQKEAARQYGVNERQVQDCCADGVAGDLTQERDAVRWGDVKDDTPPANITEMGSVGTPRNFKEFIYRVWGAGVAKHFAIPYNQKLWTVPLNEMETSWLGGRVPLPNLEEMIDGALQPVGRPVGPNARFGYPLRGGFQALMNGFLPLLKGELMLNTEAAHISPRGKTVTCTNGRQLHYQSLVSTLPLPVLVKMVGDEAPQEIHNAAQALRHVSVRCVNLGIGRERISDKHWIYYPEDTVFHRIFLQGNASPFCNPKGGFGLTCEISYSKTKPLPVDGEALIQRCIDDCVRVGLLNADDRIMTANLVNMPYAYVIYDHARAANVQKIRTWLAARGIYLAGRYSEWEYYNSDHAFLAGKRVAEAVRADETQQSELA